MKGIPTIILNAIILLTLAACSREQVDYLGPAVAYAPDDFKVQSFSVSTNEVDFTQDSVFIDAIFSHKVSWILTITGTQSGAVWEQRGLSEAIDGLFWKGGHDQASFFRLGEEAVITLSFFGTQQTAKATVLISHTANLRACGLFPVGGDFEDDAAIDFPSWARFNVAEQGVDSVASDYAGKAVPAVEGNSYYFIKGLGTQPVFVDGIQFLGPWSSVLPANPAEVWFNIYVYGTGDPNVRLDIELQEEDADGESFGYTGTDDDAFVATIIVEHTGWKLMSFRYSELQASANADFGGSGNKIHEPDRLRSFVLVLLKNANPDAPVEVYFDYPILTVGGPFNACKS